MTNPTARKPIKMVLSTQWKTTAIFSCLFTMTCLANFMLEKETQKKVVSIISKGYTLLITRTDADFKWTYYAVQNETLKTMPKWDGHAKFPVEIPDEIIRDEISKLQKTEKYEKVYLSSIGIKRFSDPILSEDWYYEIMFQCWYPDTETFQGWTTHTVYVLLDAKTIVEEQTFTE